MDSTVFAPAAEAETLPSRWPQREDVFAHAGEVAHGEPEDVTWRAGEPGPAGEETGGLEAEGYPSGPYELELEGYGSPAGSYELPASLAEGWDHEAQDHCPARPGYLCVQRVPLLAKHRGRGPDLILRWNVSSVPEVIDVVVHLHGYWYAGMTLRENIEPFSGLDLTPIKGATGQGRSRPTLTVLPRGNDTGRRQKAWKDGSLVDGPYNVFDFPQLTTPDGLAKLIDFSLGSFAAQLGGAAPRVGRRILTAHSGGGAALLQILGHCNPDQIHIFDALYQSPAALKTWALGHIQQDRTALAGLDAAAASQYMATRGGALRVFYGNSTRRWSGHLRDDIAAKLDPALARWYRVEASSYGHFQIPRRYGWRVLADAAADVPDARTEPVTHHQAERWEAAFQLATAEQAEPGLGATGFVGEYLAEPEHPELMAMETQSAPFETAGFDHEMPLTEGENAGYEGELDATTPAHEALSAAFEAADLALQRSSWEVDETEDEEETESGEVEFGEAEAFLESLYSREPIFGEATAATVTFPSGAALRVVSGPTGEGQEHYDPCATGNPLLDTSEPVRATLLSPSFTVGELIRSGGMSFPIARIDPGLVRCLQQLRDYVRKPVNVTSGYRPYAYNDKLYKETYKKKPTKSRHSSGQAADVRIAGMSGMEIAKAAIDVCGPNIGVGIAGAWAHLDVRGSWARWTYFGERTDRNRLAIAEIDAYRRQHLGRLTPAPLAPSTETPVAEAPSMEAQSAEAPSRETSLRILDALGRGLWDTAVRIAIGAGVTDVNQLTNMLFYLRNPNLRGKQIGPGQGDLVRQWTEIRDRWVRPALIGAAASKSTPPVALPPPQAAGSVVAAPAFTRQHYQMSDKEVLVVQAGRGRREVRRRVTDIVAEVLRLAGEDPVAWFNDFTSGVTFLGWLIRDPIHVHLAEHLRGVERALAARFGGAHADPTAAGAALGLNEEIIGSRPYPTSATVSMHMFGLAVDVNYTENPFISTKANPVFARAGQLINRQPAGWHSDMTYAQLAGLNKTLKSYFALLDHTPALQALLTAATSGPWQGRTVAQAQAQIQADLNDLAHRWKRTGRVVRTTGFINLRQELVNGIGLSWGAGYGDMMHFDMRSDSDVGQRIRGAISRWIGEQNAKARLSATP